MFIKRCYSTVTARKPYYHYQLVESFREGKKVKHRVIANLGSLTDDEINRLIKSLNRLRTNPYKLKEPN
jgi:hypothetical protein